MVYSILQLYLKNRKDVTASNAPLQTALKEKGVSQKAALYDDDCP
ncbi:MAG: hypothetical protein AB1444_05400 [Spirochaetota bacterium]